MKKGSILTKMLAIGCSLALFLGTIASAVELPKDETALTGQSLQNSASVNVSPRYLDPDSYEPNNSYTQAPDLTPDDVAVTEVKLTANFHQMNDVDWYKITFYYDYDASFYIGQVNQGDSITLYKEDAATQIASKSVPSGATSAVISASLSPGVYYIKVVGDPQENDTDGYFMEIMFNRYPINEPNGQDAYLYGTPINISDNPDIEDKVTNSDKYKLYKVDVPSTGYLELDYNISCDDSAKWKYGITLYKLDDQLKVIEQQEADLSDLFRLDVTAGEKYSIKVWSEVGTLIPDTNFRLMFFYAEGDRYEHNNTREQAYDISSAINGVSSYQLDATIHNAGVNRNDVDYYKLIPNENCTLTVTCSGYGMNFILLDGNEAEDGKTAVTTETKELVQGNTYYIKLYCKTSSFNAQPYILTFTKTTAPTPTPTPIITPDTYEPNNTEAQATNFYIGNEEKGLSATLHSSTDVDYYKIIAGISGYFSGTVEADGDIQLSIYDEDGNQYTNITTNSFWVSNVVYGKSYYLKVSGKQCNYSFSIYSAYDDDPADVDPSWFSKTSNWEDTTGRGMISSSDGVLTMDRADTENPLYYNYTPNLGTQSNPMRLTFDVKFTENDMELQIRDKWNNSASGFTMLTRIKKYAYYIEYYSMGQHSKLLTPSGSWLQIKDTSKWYTIQLIFTPGQDEQSIYLYDTASHELLGVAEHIPLNKNADSFNLLSFSSTDTLSLKNMRLEFGALRDLMIDGKSTIVSGTSQQYYTYGIGERTDYFIAGAATWSIDTPINGVSIDPHTGVLTVDSSVLPGQSVTITAVNNTRGDLRASMKINII